MPASSRPTQHLGFEFAAWYWHFVDVVWLFLFACIYVWGAGAHAATAASGPDSRRSATRRRPLASGVARHEAHAHRGTMPDERAVTRRSPSLAGLAGPLPALRQGQAVRRLPRRCRRAASACGLDYSFADAGDGPAVFVMLIAGFIVVGAALVVEVAYQPPFWVHALLWLPLILLVHARRRCGR